MWLYLLLCAAAWVTSLAHNVTKRQTDDLKIVCYYSNWAVYRPGLAKFTPQNINPYLCTHLIYAFVGMNKDYELKAYDPYNDIEKGNYKKFVGLKSYNTNLKLLVAVGGWNEGSKRFSKLVDSYATRQRFVRGAIRFLREHGFDGLDLDWEYPGFREGGAASDKEGYAQLVKELREAFDAERAPAGKDKLLLSIAVPAGQDYIDKGFDMHLISKHVDFMCALTYDYHTAYESETHHHAPLFKQPDLRDWEERSKFNVEWTVNYYLQLGVPKNKLIVGIPTYGRSYTLQDPKDNELEAPTDGPGDAGPSTREKGYLAYYEICRNIKDDDWDVKAPYPKIMGPYAYKDNQWVGFDDEDMVIEKAQFILDRGLGGAMVWTLDNDDFRGHCGGEPSTLITTLRTALLSNSVQSSTNRRTLARAATGNRDSDRPPIRYDDDDEEEEEDEDDVPETTTTSTTTTTKASRRRNDSTRRSSGSSSRSRGSSSLRTPAPPPTPDPGPPFECSDEGFFNNPKDCRKYFWCLDSGPANLGIVPHAFTCPSGLYFNSRMEACDYPENVNCKTPPPKEPVTTAAPRSTRPPRTRKTTTKATTTTTTTTPEPTTELTPDVREALNTLRASQAEAGNGAASLAELLRLLQSIGGVEKLQSIISSNNGGVTTAGSTRSYVPQRDQGRQEYGTHLRKSATTTPKPLPLPRHQVRPPQTRDEPVRLPPAPAAPPLQNQLPRRPQHDPANIQRPPIFSYVEPARSRTSATGDEDESPDDPQQSDYPFVYQTPSRTREPEMATEAALEENDGYSGTDPPSTTGTRQRTNSGRQDDGRADVIYRVPVRIQAGRVVRIQGDAGGPRRAVIRLVPVAGRHRNAGNRAGDLNDRNPEEASDDERVALAPLPIDLPILGDGRRISIRRRPVYGNVAVVGRRDDTVLRTVQGVNGYDNRNKDPPAREEYAAGRRSNVGPDVYVEIPLATERPYLTTVPSTNTESSQSVRDDTERDRPVYQDEVYEIPIGTVDGTEPEYDDLDYYTDIPGTEPPRPPTTTTTTTRRPTTRKAIVTTTTTTRRPTTRRTTTTPPPEHSGPPLEIDTNGDILCFRRGVFRHPEQCEQFVACAPKTRGKNDLHPRLHNCPAEQIFLEDIGRCMKGDRQQCRTRK